MRTLFITDLHFGIYQDINLLEYQFSTIRKIIQQENPGLVIIGGDVFHYRNPRAKTLLRVKEFFDSFNHIQFVVITGNHDRLSKSGSLDTTLDLVFTGPSMMVVKECLDLDEIWLLPHYEDIKIVEKWIKSRGAQPKIAFGHFAYKGEKTHPDAYVGDCIDPKLFWGMKNAHLFLGHIHHPSDVKNIHCVGTQYSVSFGEANEDKRYLVISDKGDVGFKPITYGIKHIQGSLEEVEELIEKNKEFTLLTRVKIDSLDSAYQQDIKDLIMEKDNVLLCDIRILDNPQVPRKNSLNGDILSITENVIDEYIQNNPSEDLSDDELKKAYEIIINEADKNKNP